jgi:hypothetical protein
MYDLFCGLDFRFTYMDDNLVVSRNPEDYLLHLQQIFTILVANGLMLNIKKCEFAVPQLDFLGHLVSAVGLAPLASHTEAIQSFPPPTDLKSLQHFLGMVNFYRRFLPGIPKTLKLLTDALAGGPKALPWTLPLAVAFQAAKDALSHGAQLAHPAPDAPLSLATDASDTHMGAVMQQHPAAGWRPLAFFSRKLSATQQRYSTFDRELTASFQAIRHLRFLLLGRKFTLLTDHKPLVAAFMCARPAWSARQQQQLAYISEFSTDIQNIPGVENVVAAAATAVCDTGYPVCNIWGLSCNIWGLSCNIRGLVCNIHHGGPSRRHSAAVLRGHGRRPGRLS